MLIDVALLVRNVVSVDMIAPRENVFIFLRTVQPKREESHVEEQKRIHRAKTEPRVNLLGNFDLKKNQERSDPLETPDGVLPI